MAIKMIEEKFEIGAISNRYKDTLNNLIDVSNQDSLDSLGSIYEDSCNSPMSVSNLPGLLEGG